MENGILIEKILLSKSVKDVVDVNNYASETKAILRKIHPDVCSHPQANSAFVKFMEMKKLFDNGFIFDDELIGFPLTSTIRRLILEFLAPFTFIQTL